MAGLVTYHLGTLDFAHLRPTTDSADHGAWRGVKLFDSRAALACLNMSPVGTMVSAGRVDGLEVDAGGAVVDIHFAHKKTTPEFHRTCEAQALDLESLLELDAVTLRFAIRRSTLIPDPATRAWLAQRAAGR